MFVLLFLYIDKIFCIKFIFVLYYFNLLQCAESIKDANGAIKEGFERIVPHFDSGYSLNHFQQSCLDFHNFFRSLHRLQPLMWQPELAESAKKWADFLAEAAPDHPLKVLY